MKVKEVLQTLVIQLKQQIIQLQIERREVILTKDSSLLLICGLVFQIEMLIQELDDS